MPLMIFCCSTCSFSPSYPATTVKSASIFVVVVVLLLLLVVGDGRIWACCVAMSWSTINAALHCTFMLDFMSIFQVVCMTVDANMRS